MHLAVAAALEINEPLGPGVLALATEVTVVLAEMQRGMDVEGVAGSPFQAVDLWGVLDSKGL